VERSDWSDEEPFRFRPPLPPEDRVWRHPSELGGAIPRQPVPGERAAISRSKLAVAVVVSATGALLVAGIVAVVLHTAGTNKPAVVESAATSFGFTASTAPDVDGLTRPSDGVVRLIVMTGGDRRQADGVVLDSRGTIVTTAAAVDGATAIMAMLADGSRYQAIILGVDQDAGAAVLSVASRPLAAASGWAVTLDPGATVHTSGQDAMKADVDALGASAVSRTGHTLSHLLKLTADGDRDAAREGTPLLDGNELVIGLCTYDASGHMYAVPIEILRAAARSIAVHGRVVVPWLGLTGRDADSGGAVLQSVATGSPASKAGLAAGDVIVALDGEPVTSMAALALSLRGYDAGAAIDLTYQRDGATRHAFAVLAEQP
jgi:S1-C subfamily serine protease